MWYEESEPFGPATFVEIQTRAWWMYLRCLAGKSLQVNKDHATYGETVDWLNSLFAIHDPDGYRVDRVETSSFVQEKTLARIEVASPTSASIYLWGPDCSLLWSALAGTDDGQAMARLNVLTGLKTARIAECSPDFIVSLLDTWEPIALHALAAMLSELRQLMTRDDFLKSLPFLHSEGYSMLVRLNRHDYDPIMSLLADNPWFLRASACLNHNATIGRLSLYGLSRSDIVTIVSDEPSHYDKFSTRTTSELIETIMSERGDIPLPPRYMRKWMIDLDSDEMDKQENFLTLGEFAEHWHRMIA